MAPETEAAPETEPAVAKALPKEWPQAGALSVQQVGQGARVGGMCGGMHVGPQAGGTQHAARGQGCVGGEGVR